ncbi:MAG: hypothetical protein WCG66_01030 [bacterium]
MSRLHFAVASTFSPRFLAILAEADRMARAFGASLSVLHAGDRTDEKVALFQRAFGDLGRQDVKIFWCGHGDTAGALVASASSERFDLFIAGTIARPNDPRNFTGTIVRELFTRTPCDLLLIPEPVERPPTGLSACLLLEARSPRWRAAKRTLQTLQPDKILILAADSPLARARCPLAEEADTADVLEEIRLELGGIAPEVDLRCIQSNTGFLICDIVQDMAPDFLLVESSWKEGLRVLPHYLDWLELVIPSRLFLFGKPARTQSEEGTLVLP